MIRDILDHLGNKVGTLELPDDTPEEVWLRKISSYIPAQSDFSSEKVKKLEEFDVATREFIKSKYSLERQMSLSLIRNDARFENKTNRYAYVSSAVDWVNQVLVYHFTKNYEIESAASLDELLAISWDFSELAQIDPDVSIEKAMGIND
jgi:hypothetical protein